MRLVEILEEMSRQNILLEKRKIKKIKIQSLEDFLKDEGVKLDEAKLGSDIPMQDYDEEEQQAYLSRAQKSSKKEDKHLPGKKPGDKFKHPLVHSSTAKEIKITNMFGKEFDLNRLKKMITTKPDKILKANKKMKNTAGENVRFYNLGLPAIKGLLYDEEDKKFKIVSTCPAAGKCQQFCYAHKGGYIQYKASSQAMTRVLNFLINHPDKFEQMLSNELRAAVKLAKRDDTQVILRWHDSGDFFSPSYKAVAFRIAKKFPEVKFYAYTKGSDVKSGAPDNFVFNFSEGAKASETKKVDFDKTKNSRVVQSSVFKDFVVMGAGGKVKKDSKGKMLYKDKDSLPALKKVLAKKYRRNVRDIITYDELMKKREGTRMKWTVIVATGDGDDAATRKDVRDTLLFIH